MGWNVTITILIIIISSSCSSDVSGCAFYHVAFSVLPKILDSHGHVVLLWLYGQYLSEDKGCAQDCWSLEVVDIVGPWDFSHIGLDIPINYPCYTYDD